MVNSQNSKECIEVESKVNKRIQHSGLTVWLTGLPSAGKTTLAIETSLLLKNKGFRVEVLDGDEIRKNLSAELGFTRKDRDENVLRIGYVARLLASHGIIVFAAVISPYAEARADVAIKHAESGVNFVEVYVSTPAEVCKYRDVKDLYKKQAAGEISGLTGIDDPYEAPINPAIHIDTTSRSVTESSSELFSFILQYL